MSRIPTTLLFASLVAACPSSRDFTQQHHTGSAAPSPASAHFFLPTGADPHNTGDSRTLVDTQGGVHIAYPNYAGGSAFYAFCAHDCDSPDDFSVVTLPTQGTVGNVMIALTRDNQPRILMNTMMRIAFAACDSACTDPASWTTSEILSHDVKLEVSGDAFALTPEGHPRFVMHAYRGYLGIGSPPPSTWLVGCDAECAQPASWTQHIIADTQNWEEATLRIHDDGSMHLSGATLNGDVENGLYVTCAAGCDDGNNWNGVYLGAAYEDRYVAGIYPSAALELTHDGKPRVAFLAKDDASKPVLVWLACDGSCADGNAWKANALSDGDFGPGLDVALAPDGSPRIAYTVSYNVLLARCDGDCLADDDHDWKLSPVELSGNMKPDEIFPYPNCNVAAWFLSRPSVAMGPDGFPRVSYRAEDISGGWEHPDDPDLECRAGVDMVFSRFARMTSWE